MKLVMPLAIAAAMLGSIPESLGPLGRESNSKASSQRGRESFALGQFEEAARDFEVAAAIRPGAESSFNLGTARIAAGDVAHGLQSLAEAFEDESLATDVRYNAGWAALDAQDWDNAIRAYEAVLRDRPSDTNAKRNLEIALRKKQQQQQQQRQQQQQQQQQSDQQSDEDKNEGDQPQADGDAPAEERPSDIDSVLRSVEQQEKEELDRMRRSRRGRKTDW